MEQNLKKVDITLKLSLDEDNRDRKPSRKAREEEFRYLRYRANQKSASRINVSERNFSESTNYIYEAILVYVKKHFHKSEEHEIVLANYSEKEGSLIVTFALVVIGTINNYSIFPDNLDRFINDIKYLFNEAFETEIEFRKDYSTSTESGNALPDQQKKSSPWKSWTSFSAAIVLALAGIFDDQIFSDRRTSITPSNIGVTESFVEHQIQEEDEKNIYKLYDILLEQKLKKAQVDQDTLTEEFLEGLREELKIFKANIVKNSKNY